MKEPYKQGRAYQFGPESCAGPREGAGEALTGGSSGQPLSSEIITLRVPTLSCQGEGHTFSQRNQDRELTGDATESQTLRRDGHSPHGNRETSVAPCGGFPADGTVGEGACRTSNMQASEESDDLVVPGKQANKVGLTPAAESVEGRGPAKGNVAQQATDRTQRRNSVSSGLSGIRKPVGRETVSRPTLSRHCTQGKSRMR